MINQAVKLDQKGISLLELLISIVVGSMVISMLMSVLVMTLNTKAIFDADNKMLDESYYIAEYIQFNVFELGPQELELITDDGTETVIHISHLYDITTDDDNVIIKEYLATPLVHKITYTKGEYGTITYEDENGVITLLHSSNVHITTGSSIELISIDASVCDLATVACDQGIIKLTLNIMIELTGGGYLSPQEFITTIII